MDNKLNNPGQEQENNNVPSEENDFQFLGDPAVNHDTKEKPASPLRRFMPVIILGVCAVLLFTAVFVLQKINKDSIEEEENTEETETISIFNFTGTSAERLEITNSLDSYAFVRKLEKTYYLEGYENKTVVNSTVLSLLTTFGSLNAVTEVGTDVTDFDQYGLKDPISTVTWIKDDTKHILQIGSVSASGNYYVRVDGENTVYTISSDDALLFCSPRMDFYNPDIYDFDQETDANYVNYFEITRKGEETIKIELQDLTDESIDSAYRMEAPISHNLSIEKSNAFTDIIANMTSCTVYSDDVSEKGLEEFGLADPAVRFTFVLVADEYNFRISEVTDKGYAYMYVEGKEFIYIVDESVIEILTYDVADYLESMSYPRSYDTIDNLVIEGGGKRYEIDITGTADDSDLKAYINNKYVEYENFAELYSHIISIEVKDVKSDLKTDDLLVTITVNCKDGTVDTLKYYKQSDLDSAFMLNGEGKILVSTSKVDQILEFAQKLYDGEEIVTEW